MHYPLEYIFHDKMNRHFYGMGNLNCRMIYFQKTNLLINLQPNMNYIEHVFNNVDILYKYTAFTSIYDKCINCIGIYSRVFNISYLNVSVVIYLQLEFRHFLFVSVEFKFCCKQNACYVYFMFLHCWIIQFNFFFYHKKPYNLKQMIFLK